MEPLRRPDRRWLLALGLAALGLVACPGKKLAAIEEATPPLAVTTQAIRKATFTVELPAGLEPDPVAAGLEGSLAFAAKGPLGTGLRVRFRREALIAPTTLEEAEKTASEGGAHVVLKKEPRGPEGFLIVATDEARTAVYADSWTATEGGATIRCSASDRASAPFSDPAKIARWLEAICASVTPTQGTAR